MDLLRGFTDEKRSIVIDNLVARLESVSETPKPTRDLDDEIPF